MVEFLLLFGSYLIGATPTGLLYGLSVQGEDLREVGSGNIGATNVLRNYGWLPGVCVLILDGLKGAVPVGLVLRLEPEPVMMDGSLLVVAVGGAAVLGHVYSVYLGFSGGKGVATSCGVYAVLAPAAILAVALVFVLVAGLTRYVSAGSLAAAFSLPLGCWFLGGRVATSSLVGLAALNSILVLWTHRGNLKRLIRGEELPFYGGSA